MAIVAAALLAIASPSLTELELDRAIRNYRSLVEGSRQLADLSQQERLELIELDRWLLAKRRKRSETIEECKERLASPDMSHLEAALLDLKCSQRPAS